MIVIGLVMKAKTAIRETKIKANNPLGANHKKDETKTVYADGPPEIVLTLIEPTEHDDIESQKGRK